MALGQGIWSGFVGLVAFLWGYYGHLPFPDAFQPVQMRHSSLAVAGLAVLIAGVGGLALIGGGGGGEDGAAAATADQDKQPLLPGADGSVQGDSKKPSTSKGKFLLGVLAALMTGLFGGSTLVAIKFAPVNPFQDGQHSVIFALSFGLCIVPVTLCFVAVACVANVAQGKPLPQFQASACALPGILSGALWNAGNIGSIFAVPAPPHHSAPENLYLGPKNILRRTI